MHARRLVVHFFCFTRIHIIAISKAHHYAVSIAITTHKFLWLLKEWHSFFERKPIASELIPNTDDIDTYCAALL